MIVHTTFVVGQYITSVQSMNIITIPVYITYKTHKHTHALECVLYNLVELKSDVRKFLTHFARDRRESRDYYRAPHGDGYKGVDGR